MCVNEVLYEKREEWFVTENYVSNYVMMMHEKLNSLFWSSLCIHYGMGKIWALKFGWGGESEVRMKLVGLSNQLYNN